MGNSTDRFLRDLERITIAKMGAIKRKEITPLDSKIGITLSRIKQLDQAMYDKLVKDYKVILKDLENES